MYWFVQVQWQWATVSAEKIIFSVEFLCRPVFHRPPLFFFLLFYSVLPYMVFYIFRVNKVPSENEVCLSLNGLSYRPFSSRSIADRLYYHYLLSRSVEKKSIIIQFNVILLTRDKIKTGWKLCFITYLIQCAFLHSEKNSIRFHITTSTILWNRGYLSFF